MLFTPGRLQNRKMTRESFFSTFYFVPCMLGVWGAPWLAKVGSQEKTCQDSAQSRTPSWGRALLAERGACLRDCDTCLLFPEEWAVMALSQSPDGGLCLGLRGWSYQGQQASCPSILPNTYITRSQQITYPRCGCEVSCPALFGLGERSVTSKNSNLFLSEKLPTAGPICMTCLQWDALLAGVCLAHGNAVCFQDSSEGGTGDLQ